MIVYQRYLEFLFSAYLKRRNTNIITVDWGKLALLPCYPTAVINTKHAGDCLSKFLMKIQHHHPSFNIHQIHLVGISLGAHVAGFAGNHIERTSGKKVDRITGKSFIYKFEDHYYICIYMCAYEYMTVN